MATENIPAVAPTSFWSKIWPDPAEMTLSHCHNIPPGEIELSNQCQINATKQANETRALTLVVGGGLTVVGLGLWWFLKK